MDFMNSYTVENDLVLDSESLSDSDVNVLLDSATIGLNTENLTPTFNDKNK